MVRSLYSVCFMSPQPLQIPDSSSRAVHCKDWEKQMLEKVGRLLDLLLEPLIYFGHK